MAEAVELAALAPSFQSLAAVVLAYLAGAASPTYYAMERMRGFGRAVADRLPYQPPAGLKEEEALALAAKGQIPDAGDEPAENDTEDTNT
jgi:hypothetical protein